MKKIIIGSIIILIVVYAALSLLSSRGEYAAERLFYRAGKRYSKIQINPDVAPPKMLASVERDLKTVIKKYPETEPAKAAYITLAEIYLKDKKYDESIDVLDAFISSEDKNIALLSRAYFLKGVIYEKQDKWDKALKEFTILKDKYYNTPIGLQMPLYIGLYHKKKDNLAEAEKAFNNAVIFYKNLEKEKRGTVLGYSSSNFLVQTYMGLENYEEAGNVVNDTIINYPTMMTLVQQLPYVELIYVKTLKQPEKATEIYNYIINKTKDDKLKKFLQDKITELETP
ncbi:MAG: hypothetical protein KAU58_06155 [Candidatus Omnitrophica bacterium]|nr:hypothetical protein [Candidatus Omnitrophota bacterium]